MELHGSSNIMGPPAVQELLDRLKPLPVEGSWWVTSSHDLVNFCSETEFQTVVVSVKPMVIDLKGPDLETHYGFRVAYPFSTDDPIWKSASVAVLGETVESAVELIASALGKWSDSSKGDFVYECPQCGAGLSCDTPFCGQCAVQLPSQKSMQLSGLYRLN